MTEAHQYTSRPSAVLIAAITLVASVAACGPSKPPATEEALTEALYCYQLGLERSTWLGRQPAPEAKQEAERTRYAAQAFMAIAADQREGLGLSENVLDQRLAAIAAEVRQYYPQDREARWQYCEQRRAERQQQR